ncbi:MAG: ABC transporter ATP-binding protein [Enterococcus sp.]
MTAIIEFKDVGKSYEEKQVIEHLNLTVNEGDFFVLVGPSGSGKTSTLKMINGLSVPTQGDIYFKEKRILDYDIQKLRLKMGYVLQQIALFPTMTVAQNIEVIPEMLGWSKERRVARVDELLESVGLEPEKYRHRLPKELSGGEQQRIGILRAIAAKPDIILMDEPFSALDPLSRASLQETIQTIHQKYGTTVVFVTHNMKEAIRLGTKIAVMKDGKLLQCDTPEQIQKNPINTFVRTFFNETTEEVMKKEKITVATIMALGMYTKQGNDFLEYSSTISTSATIEELSTLLIDNDAILIRENDEILGTISRQDVFRFLSQNER